VVLFTTSIQVNHLLQTAGEMGLAEAARRAMKRIVVGSIGPTTTEGLAAQGLAADLEASQPRMGILVTEAAHLSAALLRTKREISAPGTAASPL
jgi:uroporphyrinogen-III synthase